MAKKTRRKSAAKGKKSRKKASSGARNKRKTAAKRAAKKKVRARKRKPAAKPKGIVGRIVGAATALVSTLTDAERLHQKLEPHVSREPE